MELAGETGSARYMRGAISYVRVFDYYLSKPQGASLSACRWRDGGGDPGVYPPWHVARALEAGGDGGGAHAGSDVQDAAQATRRREVRIHCTYILFFLRSFTIDFRYVKNTVFARCILIQI